MKPKYMLDTNICIYLMKQQPAQVQARFQACFEGEVLMSSITLAELNFGVAASGDRQVQNQAALEALLEDVKAAPFDGVAAQAYGPVRLARRDRQKNALDKLIAAHALSLGVTLVTNNEADFSGFEGLRIENWVRSD